MFDLVVLHDWLITLPPLALVLLAVALMDLASGAYLAWVKGYFSFEELPRFLQTLGGYALAWIFAEILAIIPAALHAEITGWGDALADVAPKAVFAAIVVGKYLGSIVSNIQLLMDKPEPKDDDAPVE